MEHRKTSILLSGLIAGAAVACGDGMTDILGHAMMDAGAALVDAGIEPMDMDAGPADGGFLADAGTLLMDAGRSMADSSTTKDAAAQTGTDPTPDGHWVLRDSSGDPIDALVSPAKWDTPLFSVPSYTCVRLSNLGEESIGAMIFNLASGRPDSCGIGPDSWRDSGVWFLDSACTGDTYTNAPSLQVVTIGNGAYYAREASGQQVASHYRWNTTSQACLLVTPVNPVSVYRYEPVPDRITNLLPDAPYTLALEYY